MLRESAGQEHYSTLIGVGLYTPQETERLTRVPARSIRRWLRGYARRYGGRPRSLEPVWKGQLPPVDGAVALSFLDLMEARFIDAFHRSGVSWPVIRRAAERTSEVLGAAHPFATRRFRTDGRRIFAEFVERSGETALLDLVRDQYAFHQVISPSLYEGIEFAPSDLPIRWFPAWPRRAVVIDPRRSFGRPVVQREGVPTEILAKAAATEGSEEAAAKWYGVSIQSVKAAVEFEQGLASEVPARS